MPIFFKSDDDAIRLLEQTMDKHHRRLREIDLRVALITAIAKTDEAGNPIGRALSHRGRPALACVRIVKAKERVQGMADAEITIDGDRWSFLSMDERAAVLDHELTHLEPSKKLGEVQRDDGGRPKLKMRLHDHEFGWFTEVADRHGKNSQEQQQARALFDEDGQSSFGFLDEKALAKEAA